MRNILLLLLICFPLVRAVAAPPVKSAETIAIVVNDDAISVSDLNDRLRLILVSSGLPPKQEIIEKLKPQVVGALIEEQLKLQESERLGIAVTDEEIQKGLEAIAAQNQIPFEKFMEALKQSNINIETMKRQIRSQISWNKLIQREYRSKVVVSEGDIDSFIQRVEQEKGRQEYLLAEIALPIDEPAQEQDVLQLAHRLTSEARAHKDQGAFFKLAQQFSRAAGAVQGGNLGWIQQGQLDPTLEAAIASLEKGDISEPVRTTTGVHILMLRDVRAITEQSIPPRETVEQILGNQRMERMQARHLLNLKSAAFIETRV